MLNLSRKTLIPFFMAGYPTMATSERMIRATLDEGVDVIEIGVPFSDPLADGPTIQKASAISLARGTTLLDVLSLTQRLREQYPKVSIVLFTYLNPILKFGMENYVETAVRSGVSATLTVDLPPEEAASYLQSHRVAGLRTVFLASPTTDLARVPLIAESSSAFIYFVSRAGVTGAQTQVSDTLAKEIAAVRKVSDRFELGVAVGFGISTPAQVLEVSRYADAVVVGSHLLNLIGPEEDLDRSEQNVRHFIRDGFAVLKSARPGEGL